LPPAGHHGVPPPPNGCRLCIHPPLFCGVKKNVPPTAFTPEPVRRRVTGMKQFLLMIALVALVGCGKKTTPAEPEASAEPTVAAKKQEPPKTEPKKPEPPKTEPKAVAKIPADAFVNTLGMPFVPVKGTEVAFCIWETRVKDYAAYAAANAGVDGSWKSPGFSQTDTHPVVDVSWEDAQAFCEWLTKKEMAAGKIKAGQKYRLPTDAEWSVAVGLEQEKGGTPEEKDEGIKDVYPWGKEWPPPKGAGNYYKSLKVDNFEYTSPVGSFAANKLGLHDMGGNVWEWCEDWYDPAAKADRVLRGASWEDRRPDRLLSSDRGGGTPGYRILYFGFRCVLVGGSGG
jgi:hypothetical protein